MQFSKDLVLKIQRYWKEKYNEEITEDTANQYLSSLADLFGCFERSIKQGFKN